MYEIVDFITTTADALGLYYSESEGVLITLNEAAANGRTAFQYSGSSSSGRRLAAFSEADGRSVSLSAYQYVQLVLNSVQANDIAGSSALWTIRDRFSLLFTTTSAGSESSLVTPLTDLEELQDVAPQEVVIRSDAESKVAMVSWKASTYDPELYPEFIANPLSVVFGDFRSACTGSGCAFTFKFNNFDSQNYVIAHNKSHTTLCTGLVEEHKYSCPQNLTVTAQCVSGFKGTIVSACPYIQPVPRCFRINPYGSMTEEWQISVTGSNTTCHGVVVTSDLDYFNLSTVGHVEVVPMMTYDVINIDQIFISSDKDSFKWQIVLFVFFLTVGVLIVAAVAWRYLVVPRSVESGGVTDGTFDGTKIDLVAFDPIVDGSGHEDDDADVDGDVIAVNDLVVNRTKRMSSGRHVDGSDVIPSPGSPAERSRLSMAVARSADAPTEADGASAAKEPGWGAEGGDSDTDSDKDAEGSRVVVRNVGADEIVLGGV